VFPLSLPDPIAIERDDARQAAQRELSKHIYHQNDESWSERLFHWIFDQLDELLSRAGNHSPGGLLGLVLIALAVVAVVALARWRLGSVRSAREHDALFGKTTLDAEAHRRRAEQHAASGEYAEAVRERLRAVVRDLEQRAVLEPRTGRTADEAAREASTALPQLSTDLADGARVFDEIWYGGRAADRAAYESMRSLDERVQAARIAQVPVGVA
jgi:hypothetical protein